MRGASHAAWHSNTPRFPMNSKTTSPLRIQKLVVRTGLAAGAKKLSTMQPTISC